MFCKEKKNHVTKEKGKEKAEEPRKEARVEEEEGRGQGRMINESMQAKKKDYVPKS
jgi:archaellum component FlaC